MLQSNDCIMFEEDNVYRLRCCTQRIQHTYMQYEVYIQVRNPANQQCEFSELSTKDRKSRMRNKFHQLTLQLMALPHHLCRCHSSPSHAPPRTLHTLACSKHRQALLLLLCCFSFRHVAKQITIFNMGCEFGKELILPIARLGIRCPISVQMTMVLVGSFIFYFVFFVATLAFVK